MDEDEKDKWRRRILREGRHHQNQPPGTLDSWAAERWLVIHGFPDDYKNRIDFTTMRRFGLGPDSVQPNNGRRYYYPEELEHWLRNLPKAIEENLEARRQLQREYRNRSRQRRRSA